MRSYITFRKFYSKYSTKKVSFSFLYLRLIVSSVKYEFLEISITVITFKTKELEMLPASLIWIGRGSNGVPVRLHKEFLNVTSANTVFNAYEMRFYYYYYQD